MGIAIRTGSPLSLNLAEPMWKLLARACLTPADITEVDRDYVPGLLCIRDMEGDAKAFAAMDMTFSTPSAGGQEIHLSNRYAQKKVQVVYPFPLGIAESHRRIGLNMHDWL